MARVGYMTQWDWELTEFFKPTEAWGDPYKIQRSLISQLTILRKHIGCPILINCGTQGEHVKNSDHYAGYAVDCTCAGLSLYDFYTEASRFEFTAIGLYPDWVKPGLHLSTFPSPYRKLWIGIKRNNAQEYVALNALNLRAHGVIS